jgi:enoyl-CoA hydratase
VAEVREVDVGTFVELTRSPGIVDELSQAHGTAALVVRLEGGAAPAAAGDVAGLPCVLIGVGACGPDLAASFDVVVANSDELTGVLATIEANPLASVSLAMLLRDSERRSVGEGLLAESAVYSLLQAGPEFARWLASRKPHTRPPESEPAMLIDRDDATLRLTLNRPHVHNAFNTRLRDELIAGLEVAAADDTIRRVEIDGAGPSFCSGGDLDEFGTFPDPATAHVIRLTRSAGRLVASLADRVTVHLHGACIGAGIEVPAFAGRVVAAADTVIALPEVGLGLVPGAGGTVSLPRRIGRRRTAWLALSGARIDAGTALAWGLVDEVRTGSGRADVVG